MGVKAEELAAIQVQRLTLGAKHPKPSKDRPDAVVVPGLYFVGGVAGLAMQIMPSGARSWILRMKVGGKRRSMGLGGYPDVPLVDARRRAREEREKADKGQDPIGDRRAGKARLAADQKLQVTFREAAESYIAKHERGWKNAKHGTQWHATLGTYCYPVIGNMLVRDLKTDHVLLCIEPIWLGKNTTATRLRGRIETVLDFATTRGWRNGENPARWRGHLAHTLQKPKLVSPVEHHAALAVGDVGAFMQKVRAVHGMSARALEFVALTATRSNETRGAHWSEIDFGSATWTIPAERMKSGKAHRVPLSKPAVELLRKLELLRDVQREVDREGDRDYLVFPSPRGGTLSDMAMTLTCRRIGAATVPHGLRSTFRDWCSERTNYPNEVAEMALAHTIENKVESAYRRGDLLEKRRPMMESWGTFLSMPEVKGIVVSIHDRQTA